MAAYQEILRADDDEISSELLQWAGLLEYWNENSDILEYYDIIVDVLETLPGVDVEREEWDADVSGRSGVMHTIFSLDPEELKIELRNAIENIINPCKVVEAEQSFKPVSTESKSGHRVMSMKHSEEIAAKHGVLPAPVDHPIYSEGSTVLFINKSDKK